MPEAAFLTRVVAGSKAVGEQLGSLSPLYILPLLLCEVVVQLAKGLKWTAILRTAHPVRYSSALRGVVIGAAATHLVPLRLDEVIRTGVVARREKIAPGMVFGTVVVDRITEILILGVVLAGLALVSSGLPQTFVQAAWALGGGATLVLVSCFLLVRWGGSIQSHLPTGHRWERLSGALSSLILGLRSLPRGRNLVLLVAGALCEWTATVVFYLLILHMAAINAAPGLSILLALGNTVSYALPNLPAALGVFEVIQGSMLEAVASLDPATAAALALSAHALLMFPVTLAGLILGFFEWRSMGQSEEC
jgi:uncharacterized protein (TIRG00374 family)